MIPRFAQSLVLVGAVVGLACVDMSAPKGAASISALQLPSPSVVVGDVMRDSTGAPAPLRIAAYDANGQPITDASAQFFVTDTGKAAHLDPTNVLVGDKLGIIHIIGQIGTLQTPVVGITVTVAPAKLAAASQNRDTLRVPFSGDSATSIGSASLAVTLLSVSDSAAQGFVVKYALAKAPVTKAGSPSPAVYLADDGGRIASADTTDASGASRKLVVNAFFLGDSALVAGLKTDSAVVNVSAFYKGQPVPGSPVKFVIPIKVTIAVK